MDCSCIYVGDTEDGQHMLNQKTCIARKVHVCGECGITIDKKTPYEFEQMVYDGRIDTFKTCMDCMSVRDAMFCDGWWYEQMWDNVRDHAESVNGQIKESCLLSLTPKAMFKVIEIIDRYWENNETLLTNPTPDAPDPTV